MEILLYENLDYSQVQKQFDKTINYLKAGDFYSADVKKMPNTGYYRAKLDDTNRLLFKIGEFDGKKYIFLLEVILNHDYDKSRFLNGAEVDEGKLSHMKEVDALTEEDLMPISFVNKKQSTFHVLDKILSFDDIQGEILHLPTPIIVIGSAGSGKTALALEKAKTLKGRVLYITLSIYLVENARNLYSSFAYENTEQEVEFLSFSDFLSMIELPQGKEIDFRVFEQWAVRYKQGHKIKDSYKLFEEFKGVLTGSMVDKAYLTKQEYLNLGIKQSIFSPEEREMIYELFVKYLDYLKESVYFDSNMLAFDYLKKVEAAYDFVIIDEVQDITNVQLYLIIKSLKHSSNFILCGDANQIVHPNFFSWSQLKSLFYKQDLTGNIIRVLAANYRNTPEVTQIANQLLRIKNVRFGSIDKESTFLVESRSKHKGEVVFLENLPKNNAELNENTNRSTQFAVLVMRNEDKAEAKKYFDTPLLFSIQEAKGLEYENIILFNIISGYDKEFRELTNGVETADLVGDLDYSRGRDKTDRSLDVYKFYVNSLYVAMTRAVKNLYVIETNIKHSLLTLLGFLDFTQSSNVKKQSSSNDDWQKEARRLELQGKQEQADAIRNDVLKIEPVPWEVVTPVSYVTLIEDALNPDSFNKKAKDQLFEYALYLNDNRLFEKLSRLKYRPADRYKEAMTEMKSKWFSEYIKDDLQLLLPKLQKYGLEYRNPFNQTPLICATDYNAPQIIEYLIEQGAKTNVINSAGFNVLRLMIYVAFNLDKKLWAREMNLVDGDKLRQLLPRYKDYLKKGKYNMTKQQREKLIREEKELREHIASVDASIAWKPTEIELYYKKTMLGRFYPKLKSESLKLKIGDRMIKIDSHQAEYFIFNVMFTLFRPMLQAMVFYAEKSQHEFDFSFNTNTFIDFYKDMPQYILPEYRRERAYISNILARNEMFKEDKYSKKLFIRIKQGGYFFNPLLEIEAEDEWIFVHDMVDVEGEGDRYGKKGGHFFPMLKFFRERLTENPEVKVSAEDYFEQIQNQKNGFRE